MSWTSDLPDEVLDDLAAIVEFAEWHETLSRSQRKILERVNNAVAAEMLIRGPETDISQNENPEFTGRGRPAILGRGGHRSY